MILHPLNRILLLVLLPSLSAEIVYARTNRLDQAEFDEWTKICGTPTDTKKVPFKVMVHVSMNEQGTKKCVGVILNKRFVLTRATCYYDRRLNNFTHDSALRAATMPGNTKIVVCADDGVNCERGAELKEVGVKNILYPQGVHYSEAYERAADVAILEMGEELSGERSICTPSDDEKFRGEKILLISEDITGTPFYEGEWEWNGSRTCGEPTFCPDIYTFKPSTEMATTPSNGLFIVQKNSRIYLLGTLKYESQTPKIVLIFPIFHDFICSNTGDCGTGYDKYMFMRETRVILNGAPLPQVSHCDVASFANCRNDPLFFRFLTKTESDEVNKNCGRSLDLPTGKTKRTVWQKYPHMAAIVNNGRICSGAFISQVHVITVSHCLFVYNEEDEVDEFLHLRDKETGNYINISPLEVRYGSECYGMEKCGNEDEAKSIKTSKVRSVIVEGIKSTSSPWRYKYQLVLLELEQPADKDVVVPICTFPGQIPRGHSFRANEEDHFVFTAAGKPNVESSFVHAIGKKIEVTNCQEFRSTATNRIDDYNCRDDNVDVVTSNTIGFTKSSSAFLGSQLSVYNAKEKKLSLYGLAHYFSPHSKDNVLGAFYPIAKNERFICWFTGVCNNGRPAESDNRKYMIYTPEYRLTRAVIDAPVQRAGKNNLSNYEMVMLEEMDTEW